MIGSEADIAGSQNDALGVLHADVAFAVISKPAGLMAHASPMARGEDDFLVDRLRAQFARDVVLVHRLDRATSGCVLVAFDRETAAALGAQFMERDVDKSYLAVCRGWPDEDFTIDYPLDGGPGKPVKKPAVTHFRRLATGALPEPVGAFETSRYALLECRPQTGRWRQIRRHLFRNLANRYKRFFSGSATSERANCSRPSNRRTFYVGAGLMYCERWSASGTKWSPCLSRLSVRDRMRIVAND